MRYARALFDVALKESDPAQVEKDLAAFVSTFESHAELKAVLSSPRVSASARHDIVQKVLATSGMAAPLAKLLVMLAERDRLELLPDLLDVYRERLLAHSNIVKGSVAAATPLAPEKLQELERRLSSATGKRVQLDASVDRALIGGIVARI